VGVTPKVGQPPCRFSVLTRVYRAAATTVEGSGRPERFDLTDSEFLHTCVTSFPLCYQVARLPDPALLSLIVGVGPLQGSTSPIGLPG
jgi:hypothetical protein